MHLLTLGLVQHSLQEFGTSGSTTKEFPTWRFQEVVFFRIQGSSCGVVLPNDVERFPRFRAIFPGDLHVVGRSHVSRVMSIERSLVFENTSEGKYLGLTFCFGILLFLNNVRQFVVGNQLFDFIVSHGD